MIDVQAGLHVLPDGDVVLRHGEDGGVVVLITDVNDEGGGVVEGRGAAVTARHVHSVLPVHLKVQTLLEQNLVDVGKVGELLQPEVLVGDRAQDLPVLPVVRV